MTIFVSGPDRVGKGTQVRNLTNFFAAQGMPVHYMHYGKFDLPADVQQRYAEAVYNDLLTMLNVFWQYNKDRVIICDRFWEGEAVYGKLYRGYEADHIWRIEDSWSKHSRFWDTLKLIMFVDEPENLVARDDGDSHTTDLELKRQEVQLFQDFYGKTKIKHKALINIAGLGPDEVWKQRVLPLFLKGRLA